MHSCFVSFEMVDRFHYFLVLGLKEETCLDDTKPSFESSDEKLTCWLIAAALLDSFSFWLLLLLLLVAGGLVVVEVMEFRLDVVLEPLALWLALFELLALEEVLKRPIFKATLPCGNVLSKYATSL